ncbi:MAG: hypothetical protein KAU20_02350 [Nanoarchaeota archaeon]|nr:hypothetical protein [Nanoarchaeota archaeon]
MGIYEYRAAFKLQNNPFYALIMAAMMKADSKNSLKLRTLFPEIWEELKRRNQALGGMIGAEAAGRFRQERGGSCRILINTQKR